MRAWKPNPGSERGEVWGGHLSSVTQILGCCPGIWLSRAAIGPVVMVRGERSFPGRLSAGVGRSIWYGFFGLARLGDKDQLDGMGWHGGAAAGI